MALGTRNDHGKARIGAYCRRRWLYWRVDGERSARARFFDVRCVDIKPRDEWYQVHARCR